MIQDHTPDTFIMDYERHDATARLIRAHLPGDVTRCRGERDGHICPRRETCLRYTCEPSEIRFVPHAEYLCSGGHDLRMIPVETEQERATRELVEAAREVGL